MFGYSEDGVTRQAVNRGHDLIKSREGVLRLLFVTRTSWNSACLYSNNCVIIKNIFIVFLIGWWKSTEIFKWEAYLYKYKSIFNLINRSKAKFDCYAEKIMSVNEKSTHPWFYMNFYQFSLFLSLSISSRSCCWLRVPV